MAAQLLNFANIRPVYFGIVVAITQFRGFADMSLFVARRLACIALGGCSPSAPVHPSPRPPPQAQSKRRAAAAVAQVEAPSSPQPVGTLNGRVLPDFATLVEQVGPAVVNVSVVEKAHRVATSGPVVRRSRRSVPGILPPLRHSRARPGAGRSPRLRQFRSARVKARASSSAPTATSSPTRTWSRTRMKSRCA